MPTHGTRSPTTYRDSRPIAQGRCSTIVRTCLGCKLLGDVGEDQIHRHFLAVVSDAKPCQWA